MCLGQVPNQDDIVKKLRDTLDHYNLLGIMEKEEKTLKDWKREAIVTGIVCEIAKPLYMGRETEKMVFLIGLLKAARRSGNSVIRRKALNEMKELADKTGLDIMKNTVETWEMY